MKILALPLAALAVVISLPLPLGAQAPAAPPPEVVAAQPEYEEPPILHAGEILKPEFLQGPHFQVRDPVPTYAGANQYTIDSDYGVFEGGSNALLVRRVREIQAIARMKEISGTDEFAKALKTAAKSPLVTAKALVTNPVGTISGVPGGLWKMMNKIGTGVKDVVDGRPKGEFDPSTLDSVTGFGKAKRGIALQFGVDPYTTNETFQRELNSVAWAAYAGQMTVTIGFGAISGGLGTALTVTQTTSFLNNELRDKSPSELRTSNLALLLKMDVTKASAEAFVNSPVYSPTEQTILAAALKQLDGVPGRNAFVQLASQAEDQNEAIFYSQSAQIIAKLNADLGVASITALNQIPVCIGSDGATIVPIQWDYVCWTERAANFVATLQKTFPSKTGYRVVITGNVSPLAANQLTALGFKIMEEYLPGPLQ